MKIIWKFLTNTSVKHKDLSEHRVHTTLYEDLCM